MSALLHSSQRYSREHATAMVCPDLAGVPRTDLPNEFTVHRVRRLPDDDASGVPVEQAAAACMRAEADIEGSLEGFVGFLRSLPAEAHLFAATDASGEVRATSASGCFGEDVNAFFVSTDPQWRGRGVASAMTSLALRDARDRGGTRACLDASSAGHNIYTRLGFHDVCPVTLFHLHD